MCLTAIADEFGAEIPCCPYTDNEGDHIAQAILRHRNRSPAILLANHGVFAWGRSPLARLKAAVMTEDVAKTVSSPCTSAGRPPSRRRKPKKRGPAGPYALTGRVDADASKNKKNCHGAKKCLSNQLP